jgi:cell division protein ZapA (FtsZ GTPase activity inhibitor)
MNEKKSYKVSIFGDTYSLVSDETEDHLMRSAQLVDSLMNQIGQHVQGTQSHNARAKQCAVLTALQIASQFLRIQADSNESDRKHKDLLQLLEQTLFSASGNVLQK